MSKQASITSFFGSGSASSKPKGPKQSSITSFLGGAKKNAGTKKTKPEGGAGSAGKGKRKVKEVSPSPPKKASQRQGSGEKEAGTTRKKRKTKSSSREEEREDDDPLVDTDEEDEEGDEEEEEYVDDDDEGEESSDAEQMEKEENDEDEDDEAPSSDDEEAEEKDAVQAKRRKKGAAAPAVAATAPTRRARSTTSSKGKKGEDKGDANVEEPEGDGDKDASSADDVGEKKDAAGAADDEKRGATTAATAKKKSKMATKKQLSSLSIRTDEELLSPPDDGSHLWTEGTPTPYGVLCKTFAAIEAVTGRLVIQAALTELLRTVLLLSSPPSDEEEQPTAKGDCDKAKGTKGTKNGASKNGKDSKSKSDGGKTDLLDVIYLASNAVAPAYECVELGVGDAILVKAIGEAYGTNPSMVKRKYEKEGDLGTVAASAKGKQRTLGFGLKPKPLLVREVLDIFRQIATTSGAQSQKWKVDKIKGLLVRAVGHEAKYAIRGLQGKLRIGLAQSTVLISLAHAVLLTPPKGVEAVDDEELERIASGSTKDVYPENARRLCNKQTPLDEKLECAVNIVKKAYSEMPSFDALVDAALTVPLHEIHRACSLRPGIPVEPMLAKPTKSVQEVLKRLNGVRFTCEYKYDGERAQVHMTPDGTTKVFSRNLLDTSEKFPEVPLYVKEACQGTGVKSFVLDTEVVAYNRETKQFVPFQVLSTRKKTEDSAESAKVQVIVQAFDLMYINGVSLLDKSLSERRDQLKKYFVPIEGKFQFALSMDHREDGDTTVVEEFLDAAVKGQCEGLMVKTLDEHANYEPSRRSLNWLKLKKDYLQGLGDSVDLVPMGAYHGRGKRTGVYGAYLLACYDEDSEEFQSVCKIGTGFSEEDLKTLAEGLNEHIIPEKSSQYNVSDSLECDIWFDPVQVWEVKAADLSKSSTHKGAIDKTGEAGRGIGLRFPRFERLRTDKNPEQATTSDQILDMYYAQDSIVEGNGGDDDGI